MFCVTYSTFCRALKPKLRLRSEEGLPGANVWNIRFAANKVLRGAEIAQFQNGRFRIEQQILRLDVPVADAQTVNVGQSAEQLVHVQLEKNVDEWEMMFEQQIEKIKIKYASSTFKLSLEPQQVKDRLFFIKKIQ